MNADALIERAIEQSVAASEGASSPPGLGAAIRHSVFPGGARVRPQLCVAVAQACDASADLAVAASAGASIELMHCASLVHDDLPCFDDANLRRGKPSVHVTYGEPLAVLAGDALIVMAFETLTRGCREAPDRLGKLLDIITKSVGPPFGIVAGQAWESERDINLGAYHRSKTGALFVGAAAAGAVSVGADDKPWRMLGSRLGEAYQIADDVRDRVMDTASLGKPAGQDDQHGRPNVVDSLGLQGAVEQLRGLVQDAVDAIPTCSGAEDLRNLVHAQAQRLAPNNLVGFAA